MPKIAPKKRWRKEALERYGALEISEEFKLLRQKGLDALRRKKLLNSEEYWEQSMNGSMASSLYEDFRLECKKIGDQFGLDAGIVEMACLLKGYDPNSYPYVVERTWPEFKVVTEHKDKLFLQWLVWETWALHLERVSHGQSVLPDPVVVMQEGSTFVPVVFMPFPLQPHRRLETSELPSRDSAFRVLLDYPAGYPPEARAEMARASGQFERELARHMGYKVAQRMRSVSYGSNPRQLRLDQSPLPNGEIYEIIDDTYGETDLSQDQKIRSRVKVQRHRAIDRLRTRFGKGNSL